MSEVTAGIVACFILLLLFLTGLELAFGMALLGFVGFAYLVSFQRCVEPPGERLL